jgi:DNA-binding GntR family transcriptional regulator
MLLYQAIREYLFSLIAEQPDMKKLPSERELLEQFNSTRITVREALIRLEAEGVIYRQNRKGWFICPPRLQWNPVHKVNFYQLAHEQNFVADTRLVSIEKLMFNSDFSQLNQEKEESKQLLLNTINLAFNQPTKVYEICRVRSLDERPVMVEEIYCLADDFIGLPDKELTGSITAIFQDDYQVNITAESSSIYVTALPGHVAKLLNLNSGASCLKIIRQRYAAEHILVDYNIEYWVHGAIEIKVESH